jgi:hypothetical protein
MNPKNNFEQPKRKIPTLSDFLPKDLSIEWWFVILAYPFLLFCLWIDSLQIVKIPESWVNEAKTKTQKNESPLLENLRGDSRKVFGNKKVKVKKAD